MLLVESEATPTDAQRDGPRCVVTSEQVGHRVRPFALHTPSSFISTVARVRRTQLGSRSVAPTGCQWSDFGCAIGTTSVRTSVLRACRSCSKAERREVAG